MGDAVLTGPFIIPGSALLAGENVLAVEVHQQNTTSSDVVFGMTLETTPRELGWTVSAHPTIGEVVKEAALAVDGEAIHFWTE